GTILNMPNTVDILSMKPGMDKLGATQVWYNPQSGQVNPYWAANNKLNQDVRNRFLMNASVKYKFTDWLNAQFQAGSDIVTTKTHSESYTGATRRPSYSRGVDSFYENHYIVSVNASKDELVGKWGGSAAIFGQMMKTSSSAFSGSAGELEVPDLFFF